eukprot:6321357-Lingulodinium_polyedra.AAC.1
MQGNLRARATPLSLVQRSRLRAMHSRARAAFRPPAETPVLPAGPAPRHSPRAAAPKVKLSALVDAAADTD